MNTVEAEPAIGFSCCKCGHYTYESDNLERDNDCNEDAIESDIVSCERCGEDHKVVRYL